MTRKEAVIAGTKLLDKMKTKGWKLRAFKTWRTCGYTFYIRRGSLRVYQIERRVLNPKKRIPLYYCELSLTSRQLLCNTEQVFKNPNEAVKKQE